VYSVSTLGYAASAPVSHQKRLERTATNAIELQRKCSKINESDRQSAAHNAVNQTNAERNITAHRRCRQQQDYIWSDVAPPIGALIVTSVACRIAVTAPDCQQLPAIALQSDQSLWGSAEPTPYHHCVDANHGRTRDDLEESRQPICDSCITTESPHHHLHVRPFGDGTLRFDRR
jgi:hypothetical protein